MKDWNSPRNCIKDSTHNAILRNVCDIVIPLSFVCVTFIAVVSIIGLQACCDVLILQSLLRFFTVGLISIVRAI